MRILLALVLIAVNFSVFADQQAGDAAEPRRLEQFVKFGAQRALTMILGVDTTVDSVAWNAQEQALDVKGLHIGNPDGFRGKHAIVIDALRVESDPRSLMSAEPEIRLIDLKGAKVNVETDILKGNNLKEILDNAKTLRKGPKIGSRLRERNQKTFRIGKGVLDGCDVSFETRLLERKTWNKSLDKLEMDFHGADGRGVTAQQALVQVFERLIKELGI